MSDEATTTNGTTAPAPTQAPAWVDERISKITRQRDEMADRVTTLEREVERLSPLADRADAWKEKAQAMETSLASERTRWQTDRALLESGIADAEVRELFQWQHSRLAEADRPEFGEWLSGLKAEGAEVPSVLAPYISQPAAAEGGMAPAPPPTTAPTTPSAALPPTNAGTRVAPPRAKEPTLGEIAGSSDEAWQQMREQLRAQYSRR